jgi:Tfp pilus assembly protein PilO
MKDLQLDEVTLKRLLVKFRPFILPVAIISFMFTLTLLVILPQVFSLMEDRKVIVREQNEVGQLETKLASLETLDPAELLVMSQQLELILPSGEEVGLMLASVGGMAVRSGVVLTAVDVLSEEAEVAAPRVDPRRSKETKTEASQDRRKVGVSLTTSERMRLRVEVRGGLSELTRFASEVIRSLPLMTVADFSFSQQAEGNFFAGEFNLKAYYLVPPTKIGAPGSSLKLLTVEDDRLYDQLVTYESVGTQVTTRVPIGNTEFLMESFNPGY